MVRIIYCRKFFDRLSFFWKNVEQNEIAILGAVFVSFFLFFSFYFFLDTFTSLDDQFFNIRFSQQLHEEGYALLKNFDWVAFNTSAVWTANILFYITLIPFTFGDLGMGIKAYAVSALAFSFTGVFYFFRSQGVQHAFLSVLAVVSVLVAPFLTSMLMTRAFVLVPIFLLLELAFLHKRWYRRAFLVAGITFLWHTSTFFFSLIVAGIYFLFELQREKKASYRIILFPLFGMLCGMVFQVMFFPGALSEFLGLMTTVFSIIFSSAGVAGESITEAMEVYPIDIFYLYSFYPILMAMFVGVSVWKMQVYWKQMRNHKLYEFIYKDTMEWTLFLCSILFLLGTFVTRRMTIFFVIFASVFVVYFIDRRIQSHAIQLPRYIVKSLVGILILAGFTGLLSMAESVSSTRNPIWMRGASEWLMENSQKGDIVFNPTINFFPTFTFYNGGYNRLVMGMDPRTLYEYDKELYWFLEHFSTSGSVCFQRVCTEIVASEGGSVQEILGREAAKVIREKFGSKYIITSQDFIQMNEILDASPLFEKVYATPSSEYYRVYEIQDINGK